MGPQAPGPRTFDVEAALGRKGEGETLIESPAAEKEQQDGDGDYVIVDAEDVTEDKNPKANATATATWANECANAIEQIPYIYQSIWNCAWFD